MASVTRLLKDFDIYKRKQGVKSLHECCGIEFLTLLEGVMAVDIPDAADGNEPLRALLIATFETPETTILGSRPNVKRWLWPKRN